MMDLDHLQDTVRRDVTCHICMELLKEPFSTVCRHTYCKPCIEKHISDSKQDGNANVKCPVCNVAIGDKIEDLTSNPVLAKLAENWSKWRSELEQNVDSYVCGICEESKRSIGCFLCEQCSIVFCKNCKDVHHPAIGALSDHHFVPLIESDGFENEECKKHKKQFANFCSDCYKPFCPDEQCYQEHEGHAMTMLSKKYQDERTETGRKVGAASEKMKNDEQLRGRYVEKKAELANIKSERGNRIVHAFEELRNMIDRKQKEILQEEEDKIGERIKNCQKIKKEADINNGNLQCVISLAEKLIADNKKVPLLLSSISMNVELDAYTAVNLILDDNQDNIPAVPEKIDIESVTNDIEHLKIYNLDAGAAAK